VGLAVGPGARHPRARRVRLVDGGRSQVKESMGRNQGVTPQNVVEVRFWVISVRAIHGQSRIMSAIAPIATECFGAGKRRYVPQTDSCTAANLR
jgi:hypothetical protein